MLAESEYIPKDTNVQNDNSQQSTNNVSLPKNVFKKEQSEFVLKTAIPGLTEQNKNKANQMRESSVTDAERAKIESDQNLSQTVHYDSKKSEISVQHPNIEEKRSEIVNPKSSIDAKTRMAESNLFENANSMILTSSKYPKSQKIFVSGYNSTPFHNQGAIAEEGHKAQDFETRSIAQSEQKFIRNLNEIGLVKSQLVDPHDKKSSNFSQLKTNEPTTDKSEEKKAEPTENESKDSRLMNSTVILDPHQNILATRYNLTISEEYFLALREGFRNIGKILNFYLQYLEEKATKGLGLPQTYLCKAVGSHAYKSLCNDAEKFAREFNSSDQPLLDQFEKIIFLVNSPDANDWYVVVYTKEQTTISIITPEESKVVQMGKIKVIPNSEEKDEILSNITTFLLIDYKNKTSTPAPESKLSQLYETSFPTYQGALNYGFYVLEMMRRVFYSSSLSQEFEVDKFKSKFSEFIKYFGDQSEGPLKYDYYV